MSDPNALLRRLFFYQSSRHAEQWRTRDGRTGYSPACDNRFTAQCKEQGFRCRDCAHKSPTALTDERLDAHLRGRITLGAYQLRDDATAGWLCLDVDADVDEEHARTNVKHLTNLLVARTRQIGLPTYVEYTGNKGFHIWTFCPAGCPARDLRRLGRWIVDSTLDEEGQPANCHVEVFPKQDQLDASDPYGNLVKVPLGRHRKTGNRCLFVDEEFKPYADQVALLENAQTITAEEVAAILDEWVPDDMPNHHATKLDTPATNHGEYAYADSIAQAARNLERLAPWRQDDYNAWLAVGMALSELGDVGLSLWDQWSRRSPKYQEGDCETKWETFDPNHGLGLGSLVHWAREDSGGAAITHRPPNEGYNLTDMGNAQRLIAQHGKDLRYCHVSKTWYVWTGVRWATDQTGEVHRRAKNTVRQIYREASDEPDDERRKALAKWARTSESEARLKAMISLAESEPGVPVLPADLDADPWLLNCQNGTLDLRNGQLKPHCREDLITKVTPVHYDLEAHSDLWEHFLDDVTGGDEELQAFLARAVGYSLVGAPSEEKLFFIHGPTAAGKSTFVEAIKATLGDYALTADFETFIKRTMVTGSPRNDIARLAGARLVASIEVDEGKRLAEGLVKTITGGDTVTARFMYKEAFEFVPQFTLWLCANHAPRLSDVDDAMWRRILRVPFECVVPVDKRDPAVKQTLRDPKRSGAAILAWAVRGCLDWQAHGLNVPTSVEEATENYRAQQDPLGPFIEECCVLSPVAYVPSRDLRNAYECWARDRGERALRGREFTDRLRERGCKPSQVIRINGNPKRCWVGIGLQGMADDELLPLESQADDSTADSPYDKDKEVPF